MNQICQRSSLTAQVGSEGSVEKMRLDLDWWASKKVFKDRIKFELSTWWRRRRGAKGRGSDDGCGGGVGRRRIHPQFN